MAPKYYIGTSGWVYPHWREVFYPPKLAQSRWLEFYTGHFSTVELNNSFYRLPTEKAFSNWHDTSPEGFIYAVKVSRFITHIKRLKDVEEPIETFLGRARHLEEKLGPLLYHAPAQHAPQRREARRLPLAVAKRAAPCGRVPP
jgi:uncharacterized protein YecE (DUF72 family)